MTEKDDLEAIDKELKQLLHIDLTYDATKMRKAMDQMLNKALEDAEARLELDATELFDHLEWAWGIIANAYGGNWQNAPKGWREAAESWRDKWTDILSHHLIADEEE